jgi:hypothetical protein
MKYVACRHHRYIGVFSTVQQVKDFLKSIPVFAGYESKIDAARYVRRERYERGRYTLDTICSHTEYCIVRRIRKDESPKVGEWTRALLEDRKI